MARTNGGTKKLIDKNVSSNIACRNCEHYDDVNCLITKELKSKNQKCLEFDWDTTKKYRQDYPEDYILPVKAKKGESPNSYIKVVKGIIKDFLGVPRGEVLPAGIEQGIMCCADKAEVNRFRRKVINEIIECGRVSVKVKYEGTQGEMFSESCSKH